MTLSSTPDKGGTELNQSKEYPSLSHITDQEAEALCQELRSRVIQVDSSREHRPPKSALRYT